MFPLRFVLNPASFVCLTFCLLSSFAQAGANLEAIARENKIEPVLLYAIALSESAKVQRGRVSPWPWTIRSDEYGPKLFDTRQEAEAHLRHLLAEGVENIDVGMMQISLKWHGDKVDDPLKLIDPSINVTVGAGILREALKSCADPVLAVGRYHSWNPEKAYSYGYRVWSVYYRLLPYF
ncbi:MAG: lytic transglycosylase domain-containing protein [Methylothermaceae bacterium]|nr:lytic transglycosylase domain-containing protein [Methylothermaceae bacterium]